MFNKKAQAAMEFLMVYGWVIMIVFIGIGALFFLGVFNPSTPSVCNIASPFVCQDVVVSPFGGDFIRIKLAATNIDVASITNIKLGGVDCPGGNIKRGIKTDLSDQVTGTDISSVKNTPLIISCTMSPPASSPGSKFSGTFEISWTKQFGVSHNTMGTFSGTIES